MKEIPNLSSHWDSYNKLLYTKLNGIVTIDDIVKWENSLINVFNEIEENDIFKIHINLDGFKAVNIDAHKKFRNIIPLTLSKYNWRVGYLDLFEEANNLKLSTTRGIQCVGAVHIHNDKSKINKYQFLFSTETESYFTNSFEAYKWLDELNIDLIKQKKE